MIACYCQESTASTVPILIIQTNRFSSWLDSQSDVIKNWVAASHFNGQNGQYCIVPNKDGTIAQVLFSVQDQADIWLLATLPLQLPAGCYQYDLTYTEFQPAKFLPLLSLAWGFGCYQFTRYRKKDPCQAQLLLTNELDKQFLQNYLTSNYLIRNLINTPAADMTPAHLVQAVEDAIKPFAAKINITSGEKLLKHNFPAIYAVGKGSVHEPHLIDVKWGDENAPQVTLVGKGICFDSGGLDIKSSAGMLLMKKDMAGAAHALGLAHLIMAQQLPVRLRLLIPAAENAISGNSFHPGDVLTTHAGLSVEVTNTDAEGRLVLCDALAAAVADKPDYLFDFSTLTGAARVALGPKIPAFFSNQQMLAKQLDDASTAVLDPLWQLPLYRPYRDYLKSNIADLTNCSKIPVAGSITAALFLQSFVPNDIAWAHFDMSAWNMVPTAGEIEEAEVMAIRAVFAFLQAKFQSRK